MEGENSAISFLCILIETLAELKCQLWRRSVEKKVKISTRGLFSIRNSADSRTETCGTKCGGLLTAARERALVVAATRSNPWRCPSTKPLLQCPRKALEQGLLDRNIAELLSKCSLRAQTTRRCQRLRVCSPCERFQAPGRKTSPIKTTAPN